MTETTSAGDLSAGIDNGEIMDLIPHRYPMLLVDRVIDLVPGESCTGIKNVTANEPQFEGHFPGQPIMPGVLMIEAMAQTACVLASRSMGEAAKDKLFYFVSIDSCRFRRPVQPGDTLYMSVSKQRRVRQVWKFSGSCQVAGREVASGNFSASIVDRN